MSTSTRNALCRTAALGFTVCALLGLSAVAATAAAEAHGGLTATAPGDDRTADMASENARPVALTTATAAPEYLAYVRPHRTVTPRRQCGRGHYFTDTQAYRYNGGALSGQRWNGMHDRTYWTGQGGRVVFDGVTFANRTRRAVIVAGWCS